MDNVKHMSACTEASRDTRWCWRFPSRPIYKNLTKLAKKERMREKGDRKEKKHFWENEMMVILNSSFCNCILRRAAMYKDILMPWFKSVAAGRSYVWQNATQAGEPVMAVRKLQRPHHPLHLVATSSDYTPLDYYSNNV